MTVDMKALKEAAEKAGGREWFVDSKLDDGTLSGMHPFTAEWHEARFIAIANPSTILSLIERCEELEGALRPFAEAISRYEANWDEETGRQDRESDDLVVDFLGTLGDYFDLVTLGDFRKARAALSKADATS